MIWFGFRIHISTDYKLYNQEWRDLATNYITPLTLKKCKELYDMVYVYDHGITSYISQVRRSYATLGRLPDTLISVNDMIVQEDKRHNVEFMFLVDAKYTRDKLEYVVNECKKIFKEFYTDLMITVYNETGMHFFNHVIIEDIDLSDLDIITEYEEKRIIELLLNEKMNPEEIRRFNKDTGETELVGYIDDMMAYKPLELTKEPINR